MTQAQKIISKSLTYAIGNILRGLASFIMLPVYTRYLAPKDYGIIELISVVLDLTLLLLGARVAVGIFKYYSDAESKPEKNQVIATALALMFGIHFLAVVVIAIFHQPISTMLDVSSDFGIALSVYSLSAVFSAVNEVFFSYLKILDRAFTYVGINMLKLVLQLSLNIFFIAYLELNYWGVIWSAVISAASMTILFGVWLLPSIGLHATKYYGKKLVKFSVPIIAASLAMYYITFSSRYYLQYFDNIDAVGIYALANKFGVMIFSLVAAPFSEYWSARQFDMAKSPGADRLFGQVFFYLVLIMLGAGTGLLALSDDFIHLSATPPYWPALPVIPWLAAAYAMQAWGDYFRFGCFYTSQNRYITLASFATVAVITLLYLYWIPREGALGAAKAIFVANIARFAIIYYFGQRLFYIRTPWTRILSCIIYFSAALYCIDLVPVHGVNALMLKGSLTGLAFLLIFATPLIELEHRRYIQSQLKLLTGKILRQD